jgi:hypothetical protein
MSLETALRGAAQKASIEIISNIPKVTFVVYASAIEWYDERTRMKAVSGLIPVPVDPNVAPKRDTG